MTTTHDRGRRGPNRNDEGRASDRGVVLLATLLLLVLLAGLAVAAQGRALAQGRVLARVAGGHEATAAASSARATVLPLVGEALLDQDEGSSPPLVRLDGEPARIELDGRTWEVTVERLERDGWVRVEVAEGTDLAL
jgi:hypothetical protein